MICRKRKLAVTCFFYGLPLPKNQECLRQFFKYLIYSCLLHSQISVPEARYFSNPTRNERSECRVGWKCGVRACVLKTRY